MGEAALELDVKVLAQQFELARGRRVKPTDEEGAASDEKKLWLANKEGYADHISRRILLPPSPGHKNYATTDSLDPAALQKRTSNVARQCL